MQEREQMERTELARDLARARMVEIVAEGALLAIQHDSPHTTPKQIASTALNAIAAIRTQP